MDIKFKIQNYLPSFFCLEPSEYAIPWTTCVCPTDELATAPL